MSDITIPAGSYASLSVAPSGPAGTGTPSATLFVADIEPVGTGDTTLVVDTNVTRAAVQRTVDMLTALLPTLPA